jgi:hypothetical protein
MPRKHRDQLHVHHLLLHRPGEFRYGVHGFHDFKEPAAGVLFERAHFLNPERPVSVQEIQTEGAKINRYRLSAKEIDCKAERARNAARSVRAIRRQMDLFLSSRI